VGGGPVLTVGALCTAVEPNGFGIALYLWSTLAEWTTSVLVNGARP